MMLSAKQLVDMVQRYLEPHQSRDYRLNVVADGIRHEDDWWYVVVQPDKGDVRAYDYAARLSEAEQDLQDKEHLNVLLVPVMPN